MRKNVFGRQFKRDTNERKALFKGLMTSLVMHDRIQTTEEKAKAIKGSVEKLVTKARVKGISARPELLPYLSSDAVSILINDIAPRFNDRPGGYTRILKLGRRFGDNASVVIMEWVDRKVNIEKQEKLGKKIKSKKIEEVAKTVNAKNVKSLRKNKEKESLSKPVKAVKKSIIKKTEKKGDK